MTLTYEQIVEAMAQSSWQLAGAPWPCWPWDEVTPKFKESLRSDARATLSALHALAEANGYRLMVPVQVTMQMELEWEEDDHPHTAAGDWTAMLSAAPDPTKEPE